MTEATAAPRALYVHFPFCLSVCPYCDFVVVAGRAARGPGSRIDALVDALVREVELRAPDQDCPPGLGSVYLGGGTPSLLRAEQVTRLLAAVESAFGLAPGVEITLECNPGARERGDLAGFRAAGVNRLSVGAQAMVEADLRSAGRSHGPADVVATVQDARRAGFDDVSLDLLYDVPGQTLDSWRATLDAALDLRPDHVSAYALTLDDPDAEGLTGGLGDHLPVSRGARRWRERARAVQDGDRAADMYLLADEVLAAQGLRWYEISNWARPGRESRHNLVYWLGGAWEAVGPGAHAHDGARTRRWNAAPLDAYVAALAAGQLPPGGAEVADEPTAAAERAMLRLRTSAGLYSSDAAGAAHARLAASLAAGLVEADGGAMRLTRTGRLLSNEVLAELLPA